MFDELIYELKKIKSPDDLTIETVEFLTDIAIAANIHLNRRLHKPKNEKVVLNMARSVVLNHFDNFLLSIDGEL